MSLENQLNRNQLINYLVLGWADMERHQEITKETLCHRFEYNDGVLYWKNPAPKSKMKPGDKVGRSVKQGYLQTCVNGKRILNHQIIFKMFYGYIPNELDHIDRNVLNNKIENLRSVTRSENLKNRRAWGKMRCIKATICLKSGK